MNHAIARRFLLLCVATAALMLNLAGPANAAEPTALTAALKAEAAGLTVSGTLTTNGQPVTGATVAVALDSTPTASATTDDAGAFSVSVPVADLKVAHTLQLSFAGTADLNPATAEATFTPAPVETRAATTVNASVADDTLYPGELITITGSLEAAGAPVPSGEIGVYLSGQELGDSLTFTGDNGSFTTYGEVPADMAPGEAALRIVHPGSTTTLPSERTVALTIQAEAPEPTEEAETPSQEPTPTAPETAAATQPPTTEAAASPDPTSTTQTSPPTDAETSPFNWFWVGALVAGGSAALVTIALLMSRAANREEKRERAEGVEPLYLLGDDEDVDYEPESHGWVTEEFFLPDDDLPAEAGPQDLTAEPHPEEEGETTQPFPAPEVPPRQAPEPDPEPEIYRSADEPIEQPKPRRSWSGEE